MKIIFENKEERRRLMLRLCPSDLDEEFENACRNSAAYYKIGELACLKCWEECGVEMEVEDDE